MLLFGHIGITAGVVKLGIVIGGKRLRPQFLADGIKQGIDSIDYRIVLLGSLLPDIVDKPVWFLLGNGTSLSGRDYAHTLLFHLILLIGGLVLIRYSRPWLSIITLSSFMHLIFDQMWNSPVVLLWPLLGPFPELETVGWLSNLIQALFSQSLYLRLQSCARV